MSAQSRVESTSATPDSAKPRRRGLLDLGDSRTAVVSIWIALAVGAVIAFVLRPALFNFDSIQIVLVLATVTIVVGLGQGAAIFVGGIDLSIPWTLTASAIMFAGIAKGSDGSVWPALIAAIALGAAIGAANGFAIVRLNIHPVVMTLAMNTIVQGAIIGYTGGFATGSPPPSVGDFMNGSFLGISPALWLVIFLTVLVSFTLRQTVYGRRLQAVGLNPVAARLAGAPSRLIAGSAYMISGTCAALAGVMLSGIAGQSYLGMGDPYLLASIAVVALGGAAFSGGNGHFLGTVAAAILMSLLLTLLVTFHLPEAMRQVVLGLAVLAAVIAGRVRRRTSN